MDTQSELNQLRAELESLKQTQSSGLVFHRYPEEGDAQLLLQGMIPSLSFNSHHSTVKNDSGSPPHLLFEGDNLSTLTALAATHKDRIDLIYIDPPYNTGNRSFVYNDAYHSTDGFKHSKWLSFMHPRLVLAKELLSKEGIIFVSIDDNSQAVLRLLMDSIFGSANFIGDVIRKTKSTTPDAKSGFNLQHENTLVYAKHRPSVSLKGKEKDFSRYKNPDNHPRGPWVSENPSARSGNPEHSYFPITNPFTGQVDLPPEGRLWSFSKNTVQKHIDNGTIVFKKENDGGRGFIWRRYAADVKNRFQSLNSLDGVSNEYLNQVGTKELKSLGMAGKFSYPKPSSFVKHLASFFPKDAIVLDFFAGSGTTGHAIAELNAEDSGQRQCILVTNNVEEDGNNNGIAQDVTSERMRRVLTGGVNNEGCGLEGELHYYTVVFVNPEKAVELESSEYVSSVQQTVSSLTEQRILLPVI